MRLLMVALALGAMLFAVAVSADEPEGSGITLEAGTGMALLRQVDLTVQVGINLGDLPDNWPVIGGRDFVVMLGWLTDGPLFAGPAIELSSTTRLGFPIWRTDERPTADVALFYVTPLKW